MTERIILVGFMCSGKSTIGRLLAQRLSWDFVDFDEEIERRQSQRIPEIFRTHGEGFFRSLEARMTEEVAGRHHVVLAPGGGWVTQPDLVERLRANSFLVWLRVQPETVYLRHRRQLGADRPLLGPEADLDTIRSLLAERASLYGCADTAVDTDGREPQEVAAEIASRVEV